jgi:signal transduction histidine kinase
LSALKQSAYAAVALPDITVDNSAYMNPLRVISFPAVPRYGLAILVSALAFGLTRWFAPAFQYNGFDLFQGAVVVSACYGGLGPGFLTAVIAIFILDFYFIPPLNTFRLGMADLLRLSVFAAVATLTSSLSARLKEAKSELEKSHQELEQRVEERTEQLTHVNADLEAEIAYRLAAEKEILQISSREQRRLGEDLHDGLCQTLAGLRLLSQELKGKLFAQGLSWASDVERIEGRLGEALTQADVVSHGIYPVELETNGLMAALQEVTSKVSTLYRVSCRFKCAQPVLIEDCAVATHLYRIAQEAVINAIKRGKAKRVTVRLVKSRGHILLSITDDGIGLHGQRPRQGMGLKMMTYRARIINGVLRIRSRSRGFTRVVCSITGGTELPEGAYGN